MSTKAPSFLERWGFSLFAFFRFGALFRKTRLKSKYHSQVIYLLNGQGRKRKTYNCI